MINKITADEIYQNSMERLADHPNAASRYGTGGLSASELKGKYDRLAKLAINRLNSAIDLINDDAENGIIKSIMTQIETGEIDGNGDPTYKTLYDVITDAIDGDFAGYLALTGLTEDNLQDELSDIESDIDDIQGVLGGSEDADDPDGSIYARINKNASDIAANTSGIAALNSNKIDKSAIVDDLITGGSNKVLSAEQGKVLQTKKVNFTDIVDNLISGGTAKVLSAQQGKDLNTRLTTEENNVDALQASVGTSADSANSSGTVYGRIKFNYDKAVTNDGKIGNESTSNTVLYRVKELEDLVDSLSSALDAAKAILEARQQPLAIDTTEYLSEWLKGTNGYTVTVDGEPFTPSDLMTGTVILIRATSEPDFWWDGGITTAGTVTINGEEYVSTSTAGGNVIGGIRELEYNFSEVNAAVEAAEAAQTAAETAQGNAETARDAAKAWTTGEGATSEDPQYENNAKYYAESIIGDAQTAAAAAAESEAWAVGTEDTEAEQHNNSAKDWAMSVAENAGNQIIAEKWATGSGATSEEPQYQNNAKYYSDRIAAYNPPESMSRPDFQTMLDNHTWIENQDYDVYEVEDALS